MVKRGMMSSGHLGEGAVPLKQGDSTLGEIQVGGGHEPQELAASPETLPPEPCS